VPDVLSNAIHGTLLYALQEQFAPVTAIAAVPLPPDAPNVAGSALTKDEHAPADCVTAIDFPPTIIDPVRGPNAFGAA
jgi:hypothetical protein